MRVYGPFRHQGPLPLVVHFHGGGFAFGTAAQTDWLNSGVAAPRAPALVVSVDYRLAPEHPFPASTQDAVDAVDWFGEGASGLNADPGPLALMGDSAGGNLAAVAAVHARDNDIDVALQVLIYPALDFTDAMLSYPSAIENPDPILTPTALTGFRRIWLGDNDPADPLISPLLTSDLRGVAPALVQTARFDPLRDQGAAYASRLRDVGALEALTEYPHAAHAFIATPGANRGARRARREIVTHLQQAFALQLAESL